MPRVAHHRNGSRALCSISDPPDIGAGEITDKGYVNQGAVQRNRANVVDGLFADDVPPQVVIV